MNVRVIIDTNIFVSSLLSYGPPALVVEAVLDGRLTAVFSPATLSELKDVLSRPSLQAYFNRRGIDAYLFLNELQMVIEIVDTMPCNLHIRDYKDQPFIELASTLPAVEFLITGDKDFTEDHYAGVKVISASEFVRCLEA